MHLHEFQAKSYLSRFGIPFPPFATASNLKEVEQAIASMPLESAVLKVQIHAGGRGKAGGVKLATTRHEILQFAEALIGMRIVNNQTGKEGVIAHQILLSPLISYAREFYVGATIDRDKAAATLILSQEGGVEIEEVAAHHPEKILKQPLGPGGKLRGYQLLRMIKFMGWSGVLAEQGKKLLTGIAQAFIASDASLLEINPLVLTNEGQLLALDAKMSIDDNALYRQPELILYDDPTQITPYEAMAQKHELAYVALDGDIGCMVNGAGLAMATMDLIHHFGGHPANFLDVGGGASQDKIAEGFKIILSHPKVKAILINIFGGILNCATLAEGIIAVTNSQKVEVPLIVRMEGTNVEEGKRLLREAKLNIILADSLSDAAKKAIEAAAWPS